MSRRAEPPDEAAPTGHSGPVAGTPSSTRGLADILSEAGINPTGRGGRRRAGADQEADSTHHADPAGTPGTGGTTDPAGTPDTTESTQLTAAADRGAAEPDSSRTDTAPVLSSGWSAPGPSWPSASPPVASPPVGPDSDRAPAQARIVAAPISAGAATTTHAVTAAATDEVDDRAPAPDRTSGLDGAAVEPAESGWVPARSPAGPAHATRSPSPVSTTAPPDSDSDSDADADADAEDQAARPAAGPIAWAILLVDLLAALGLGVAAWYAFSALWNLLPYVAAFAGPLVVTGLVAVAGALRARNGRNPLGLPTLCVLVLAGTVLVVLPAATLIVP